MAEQRRRLVTLGGPKCGSGCPTSPAAPRCPPEAVGQPVHFRYLRVSVTDRCNLRCVYCMPQKAVPFLPPADLLTLEEHARVVTALAGAGIEKVRITGGEPLLRRRLPWAIEAISRAAGIREVVLTTNGLLLADAAGPLARAGLRRLNVSLDSLDPDTFARITRGGSVADVLAGLDAACAAGLAPVKVNVVVLGGINDRELPAFAELALARPVEVRFIERMPVGGLGEVGSFVPEDEIRRRLDAFGLADLGSDGGPARRCRISDGRRTGTVGFISAMSRPFCTGCDRLRLTSDGRLRACLFSGSAVDVRSLVRGGAPDGAIVEALHAAARLRTPGLHGPRIAGGSMSEIGG